MSAEVLFIYALIAVFVILGFNVIRFLFAEPTLGFNGKFRPHRHYLFERCCKCGKKLKHYHWFWGKGDYMACDVDYHGNTDWYCKECDDELSKNTVHEAPHE